MKMPEDWNRCFRAAMMPELPQVRNLAVSLARAFPGPFSLPQCIPLMDYVHHEIAYVNDPKGSEYFASPLETMNNRAGDCDDQAILLANLVMAIGGYARIVVGFCSPNAGHAWVEIRLEGDEPEVRRQVEGLRQAYRDLGRSTDRFAVAWESGCHWLAADPTNSTVLGDVRSLVESGYLNVAAGDFHPVSRPGELSVFHP